MQREGFKLKINRRTFLYTFAGVLAGFIAFAIAVHVLEYTIRGDWSTALGLAEIFASITLIGLAFWLVTRPGRLETIEEDSEEDDGIVQEAFDAFSSFENPRRPQQRLILDDQDDETPPAA